MRTSLFDSSLGLAISPSHPYFVGLAHLRSLLAHEEVAQVPARMDSVLDMISLLLRKRPANQVVKAFCDVRESCEPVCYLALFRLRRWLEDQVVVGVNGGVFQPLELSFKSFRRIIQAYQRQAWEWQEEGAATEVAFHWKGDTRHQLSADDVALTAPPSFEPVSVS